MQSSILNFDLLIVIFPFLIIVGELLLLALVSLDQLVHLIGIEIFELFDLDYMVILNGLDFFFVFDAHIFQLVF